MVKTNIVITDEQDTFLKEYVWKNRMTGKQKAIVDIIQKAMERETNEQK